MAVLPGQVKAAFATTDGIDDIESARDALDAALVPLFNSGGGGTGSSPFIFTQATPSSTWGPFVHNLGRPVSVETIGPNGEEFDCAVINSPSMDSVTIHLGLAIAGKAVIF